MSSPRRSATRARVRPLAAALVFAAAWLLVHAQLAGAAAGGGSSSFGGGSRGGGGFGGGGGSFGGGGTGGSTRIGFGGVIVIGLVIVLFLVIAVIAIIKTIRYNKRRHEHQRRVELAAAEAAGDDESFAPEAVRAEAERIFREAQGAWDARDDAKLAELLVPELHTEWRRRLADFASKGWHNRVEVLSCDEVRYLGLTNREGHRDDRVTVRIRARLRDYVVQRNGYIIKRRDDDDLTTTLVEYWTLAKRHDGGGWIIASIESDAEGRHVLDREIVATPWGDEVRMGDQSMLEVAAIDKLPDGVSTAEVADLDYAGDARTAALDLSLVDGRWAPDVLEVSVRRAVAAWAEAVDGADADLLGVATPQAAQALLHPGDTSGRTRLVIRGPRVRQLTIAALDPAATPPTITVEVHVSGRRYIEDRDTAAVLSGSKQREVVVTERWTLALAGPDEQPWQVTVASADADAIGRSAGADLPTR